MGLKRRGDIRSEEEAALGLGVSKKAGRGCRWISYLSTWVDSETTSDAGEHTRKSGFGGAQRGWACLQLILVRVSPREPEICLGTPSTQESGWNPVVWESRWQVKT